MDGISRRGLLLGTGATVATAALAGCGGGGGSDEDAGSTTSIQRPGDERLDLIVVTAEAVAGREQRLGLGVLKNNTPLRKGVEVRVAVGPDPAQVGDEIVAEFHNQGIEERPYYAVRLNFERAGQQFVVARAGGLTAVAPINVVAADAAKVIGPGQAMLPVATPIPGDNRGVNPPCTRKPPCPLHDVSLDAALEEGRPMIAVISTPALCQTAICGPVLDNVLVFRDEYGDRVRFLHLEVFADLQGQTLSPVMKAYKLLFEPVTYLVGADGVVRDRIDGPLDRVEAEEALAALVRTGVAP